MVRRSDALSDDRPWCSQLGTGRCWSGDGKGNSRAWDITAEWQDDQPAHIVTHEGHLYDLTALETPFGLLPEPVQEALKAWPHGVCVYGGNGWWDVSPEWDKRQAYRAIPAEIRIQCYRGGRGVNYEYGTCIKNPDGSLDWASWEPDA